MQQVPKKRKLEPRPTVDPEQVKLHEDELQRAQVDADVLRNGSFLQVLADDFLQMFARLAPSRPVAPCGARSWGTLCSGSDGCHFVFEAMQEAYKKVGSDVRFQQSFACEVNDEKRQWIRAMCGPDVCIFKDIQDMGARQAPCAAHQRQCPIKGVDVLVLGTSCKDLSRCNSGEKKLFFEQSHSRGGTSQTFRGFIQCVERLCPPIILYENVDSMDDNVSNTTERSSNMDVLMAEMGARGYEAQAFLTDASSFGLPARRRRFYIVFIRASANLVIALEDAIHFASMFRCGAPSA